MVIFTPIISLNGAGGRREGVSYVPWLSLDETCIDDGDAITCLELRGSLGNDELIASEHRGDDPSVGVELAKPELDRLALLGPHITVSIVKDGKVAGKRVLDVPARLVGILECKNATCITRGGEPIPSVFLRIGGYPYRFKCAYCERVMAVQR